MKRQLKRSVVYGLYALSFTLLVGGTILLSSTVKNSGKDEYSYVSKGILDYEEEVKVVNTDNKIGKPYNNSSVKIVKNYYDYLGDASIQEKSLIYYEGTYIQSSGVSYSSGEQFDIISVLPGTVKEVKEDETLGNSITIDHNNGIYSVYQSIADINVKNGDVVNKGDIIAKSSTSNISTELDNHLYFELIINGVCVNPENYYDKSINEI